MFDYCRHRRGFVTYETGEFPLKEWVMMKIEQQLTHEWYVTQHDPLGSFYYANWLSKSSQLTKLLEERENEVKSSFNKLVEQGLVLDKKIYSAQVELLLFEPRHDFLFNDMENDCFGQEEIITTDMLAFIFLSSKLFRPYSLSFKSKRNNTHYRPCPVINSNKGTTCMITLSEAVINRKLASSITLWNVNLASDLKLDLGPFHQVDFELIALLGAIFAAAVVALILVVLIVRQ